MELLLKKLNTFNKGRWIWFPSKKVCPNSFLENCHKLCELFQGTDVCLKDMKYAYKYLSQHCFFVFVDNENSPQIVGDYSALSLEYIRGICDGYEQNINIHYLDVANELLNNLKGVLYDYSQWQKQINWIERLKKYEYLFKTKKYDKINISELIDDLGYNGYSLHYNQCHIKDKIYYPISKRNIIKEPMLKPLIAKYLGCKTDEIYVGKYYGNGKNKKYIIGDLLSRYLHKDCKIRKVFGSLDIKNYEGEFQDLDQIKTTLNFKVTGWCNPNGFNDLFKNAVNIHSISDFNRINEK